MDGSWTRGKIPSGSVLAPFTMKRIAFDIPCWFSSEMIHVIGVLMLEQKKNRTETSFDLQMNSQTIILRVILSHNVNAIGILPENILEG